MKKLLLLALVSLLTLTACGKKTDEKQATNPEIVDLSNVKGSTTDFVTAFANELNRLDYIATNEHNNTEHLANFIETLLENDTKGNYVPSLAEKWERNEDSTVFTFHLRKGVKWVTAEGEEYGEVKADDFVAGLQHAFDSQSKVLGVVEGIIKGVSDFKAKKTTDFSTVGVKALDDYTVQYTLEKPTPYFHTLTTYNILMPVSRSFLESKGCPLGGDQTACTFGGTTPDSILYNGAYILTSNVAKSEIKYIKNEKYWDKDKVSINTVTYIFDDGSDSYSVMKGFLSGTYVAAGFNAKWADYKQYVEKYANYKTLGLPNSTTFGIQINFNRKNYNHTKKNEEEIKIAKEAVLNKNFRLALGAAFDIKAYLMASLSEEVAQSNIRNINNAPDIARTSDGTRYVDLVTKAYDEITGTNVNLEDGQAAFFNPEKVQGYLDAAEKDGIKFPVKLDVMLPDDLGQVFLDRGASLKESIEKNTGGKILIDVNFVNYDVVKSVAFSMEDPSTAADYDINTFAGWGPDYSDPYTFANVFNPDTQGDFLKNIGLLPTPISVEKEEAKPEETTTDDAKSEAATSETTTTEAEPAAADSKLEMIIAENEKIAEIAKTLKFDVYNKMVQDANSIVDNDDARYVAFAKAEAFLLSEGLFIPTSMQTRNERVSRVIPFTAPFAVSGAGGDRLKGLKLSETVITKDQYESLKAEWEKN